MWCLGFMFLNLTLSSSICNFLRFLSGLSPTLMFAAILVKTRKIHKIFQCALMKSGQRYIINKWLHLFTNYFSSSLMDKTNLDFCPSSIESRLHRLMEPKPRQILTILLIVFIQFIIICCWASYKYLIINSSK